MRMVTHRPCFQRAKERSRAVQCPRTRQQGRLLNQKVRQKPKHVGEGLVQGGERVWRGVSDGITGIVVRPMQGAQKDGVPGFLVGLGQGVWAWWPTQSPARSVRSRRWPTALTRTFATGTSDRWDGGASRARGGSAGCCGR